MTRGTKIKSMACVFVGREGSDREGRRWGERCLVKYWESERRVGISAIYLDEYLLSGG